ncbi:FAD-dependent oxidoreductase [Streptosporangium sp. NPDC023963]|uniref:FAD-dependent oxidoreductase n=1 Tax=Streptosporangium sp. NPDC023963 TaxID=3155608 RepID=UPI003445212F
MDALTETPDHQGAFPRLDEAQIATLAAHGVRRPVRTGELLIKEGEEHPEFVVILTGKVAVVEDERVLWIHGPGRFPGELGVITGRRAFLTSVVCEAGEVLTVPVERLRRIATRDRGIGDLILRAYLVRRPLPTAGGAGLRIVGSRYSPGSRRLREFAARNRLPHRWIDLEEDGEAEALVLNLGVAPDETPVVILGGTRVLRNPSDAELARATGLPARTAPGDVHDLVIVGAGPAGLAAALYGASEGLDTVVLEAVAAGGQAGASPRVENHLGFPSGISGGELAERALIQSRRSGARFGVPAEAVSLERMDGHYDVGLGEGGPVRGRTIVIATGARYRRLDVPRLESFEGNGVHYAATVAEAGSCGGGPAVVVGGGNSAGQATILLARYASSVRLVVRGGDLGERMSRYLTDRIRDHPRVEVTLGTEVRELVGARTLEAVLVENRRTGERTLLETRSLFVLIGADPRTGWLSSAVTLDDRGFVVTGFDGGLPLETSLPGVFAVGDVRSRSVKRVASAVGEGATAVRLVHEHVAREMPQHTSRMVRSLA